MHLLIFRRASGYLRYFSKDLTYVFAYTHFILKGKPKQTGATNSGPEK